MGIALATCLLFLATAFSQPEDLSECTINGRKGTPEECKKMEDAAKGFLALFGGALLISCVLPTCIGCCLCILITVLVYKLAFASGREANPYVVMPPDVPYITA